MNNVKTRFSIKDLENLSGIKAHTIRIWEKRYNLFEPNRTETNIRYYSLASLQKLLNITFLNKNGYKVSKIAELRSEEIPNIVREIAKVNDTDNHYVDLFKVAMLNFDQTLFYKTFREASEEQSLSDIFHNVFVPLLEQIGLLWQTDTITPAHEHFIFELIKQKILIYADKAIDESVQNDKSKTFVLFLPDNEIHELGLLFVNYELILKGYKSIYLGQSVPIDSLEYLTDHYDEIVFISSFTIKPDKEVINNYLDDLADRVLKENDNLFLVSGRQTHHIDTDRLNDKISIFNSTKEVLDGLDNYLQQVG